jgi:type IV pilus assembly protein PilA
MAGAVLAADGSTVTTHALCASTEKTVPASITSISGRKYQSNPAALEDWNGGEATNKGFPCLKFSMQAPQYYMYNYSSDGNFMTPVTGTQFTATANGDLNGDGVYSTFMLVGAVANNQLFVAPNLIEMDPEE